MEKYVWEGSQSQRTLQQLLERMSEKAVEPEVIQQYAQAITRFHNEGKIRSYAIGRQTPSTLLYFYK